jgi:hypothetical protein
MGKCPQRHLPSFGVTYDALDKTPALIIRRRSSKSDGRVETRAYYIRRFSWPGKGSSKRQVWGI